MRLGFCNVSLQATVPGERRPTGGVEPMFNPAALRALRAAAEDE